MNMQERPISVTIFGILNIGFALLGLLGTLISMVVLSHTSGNGNPFLKAMYDNPHYVTWMKISVPLGCVGCLVLLAAGIGLLLLQKWARIMSIGYGIYAIVSGIAGGLIMISVFTSIMQNNTSGASEAMMIGSLVGYRHRHGFWHGLSSPPDYIHDAAEGCCGIWPAPNRGMKEVSFKAPWGVPLVLMTTVCTLVCICLSLPGLLFTLGSSAVIRAWGMSTIPPWAVWLLVAVPLLTLVLSAAFMVRGYVLTEGFLSIKRLGWEKCLNLARLNSATIDPDALHRSTRIFGNGGFFSFTGWFRNKKLGVYHAYATDTQRAVVLRFADKIVVVTPDDPQKFVAEINACKSPAQS